MLVSSRAVTVANADCTAARCLHDIQRVSPCRASYAYEFNPAEREISLKCGYCGS